MTGSLVDLEQARALVLERVRELAPERVALGMVSGRVLAENVVAAEPVPGFDNAAMDGYAVRAADTRGATEGRPARLRLVGVSRAGTPAGERVAPGEAIAISTGAMLPAGADAVVRVEETSLEGETVCVRAGAAPGGDVRHAADDIAAGACVLLSGTALGAVETGLLASVGCSEVACFGRPRVQIVVTGDELVEPGEALRPGQARDANGFFLPLLARAAGAEVHEPVRVGDDPEETRARLDEALDAADVVVVCGGMSVGAHDHVRPALEALAVEQVFWGLRLKPGKPTYFGVGARGAPLVFGLPGNPVSALVIFLLVAWPALRALQGDRTAPSMLRVRIAEAVPRTAARAQALRCRVETRDDGLWARPMRRQGSHVLTSMLGAHGLVVIPEGSETVAEGRPVEFLPWPASVLAQVVAAPVLTCSSPDGRS